MLYVLVIRCFFKDCDIPRPVAYVKHWIPLDTCRQNGITVQHIPTPAPLGFGMPMRLEE